MKQLYTCITNYYVLLIVLLFGFGLRMVDLLDPLLDVDSYRQSATASIARNYHEFGYSLLNPRITGWGTVDEPGLWPNEFPLYPYVISKFYFFFGVQEWFGRLLTAIFSVAGGLALFCIVRELDDETTATFSALWYVIAPQAIYHGRCFHRHPVAISIMLFAIYIYLRWLQNPGWLFYVLMVLFTSISILMMPPLIFFSIPFLLIHSSFRQSFFITNFRLILSMVVAMIPVFLWYYWAIHQYNSFSLNSGGRETFRNWTSIAYYGYWWKYDMFRVVWWSLWQYTIGPIGLTLGCAGLFFKRSSFSYVPLIWLAVILMYYIIDIYPIAVTTHYVYFLLLVPVLSWGAGRFMSAFWQAWSMPGLLFGLSSRLIFIGLIVFGTVFHWDKTYRSWYDIKHHYGMSAEEIRSNTDKSHRIVVDVFDPSVLYYSDRLGLCKSPSDITLENLKKWESNGVTHLAITDMNSFFGKTEVRQYLKETARNVVINDFVRLYALRSI